MSARWGAIALGFSIPFTVALNNVLLALTLISWFFSGEIRERIRMFAHPGAIAALALYGLIVIGSSYADVDMSSTALHLRKYADLLLIPIFLWLFRDATVRRRAIHALAVSLALILAASYLTNAGLMPANPFTAGTEDYPIVFKKHLTHNILVAFSAFLFAWLAVTSVSTKTRTCMTALAMLALINVTALVHGATGYLILIALFVLFGYRLLGWRGAGIAVVSMTVLAVALMAHTNPFQQRIAKIEQELQELRLDEPADTSTALRIEFYRTTLSAIADHPLIGVGTGGFASAYADKVEGTGKVATQNPHNEFLLMWAQLGIAGLVVLIWLFWRQWQLAARLPTRLESELARGLVVTMVIGCMLNSLLLDHTEGLFYAWLTGVLYGGLNCAGSEKSAQTEAQAVSESAVR